MYIYYLLKHIIMGITTEIRSRPIYQITKSLLDFLPIAKIRKAQLERAAAEERMHRLQDIGVLAANTKLPTIDQLVCGEIEMAPFVIEPKSQDHDRYNGLLRVPLLRTPALLAYIGSAHLNIFSGIDLEKTPITKHILATRHPGDNPIYDLQLLMIHEDGLDFLEERVYAVLSKKSARAEALLIKSIMGPQVATDYWTKLLDEYIPSARDLQFPRSSATNPENVRSEFYTLKDFIEGCAEFTTKYNS